jgi:hypothetical protein
MAFNVRWIYRLEGVVQYRSAMSFPASYIYRDDKRDGKIRMVIARDGVITIFPRYSWDGCSPKFSLLDLYIGTPDGAIHAVTGKPKTYYASLFHDALYQYYRRGGPYSLKEADGIFLHIMKKHDFRLRMLYYVAVRLFGAAYLFFINLKRKNRWRREDVEEIGPEDEGYVARPFWIP